MAILTLQVRLADFLIFSQSRFSGRQPFGLAVFSGFLSQGSTSSHTRALAVLLSMMPCLANPSTCRSLAVEQDSVPSLL